MPPPPYSHLRKCLLLILPPLLAACGDEPPKRIVQDACVELTCVEGTCRSFSEAVPRCDSPATEENPDGEQVRIALPATYIPLPATGTPVAGGTDTLPLHTANIYFSVEATGRDWYRLTGTCREMYGCTVTVANDQGMVFHERSSVESGGARKLETVFRPVREGRTIVVLSGLPETENDRYSLQLERIPDDHGDTAEAATALTRDGSPFGGHIDTSEDRDVFTFEARQGERFIVDCDTPAGTLLALGMQVFSGAERLLPEEPGSPDQVFLSPRDGPYFIEVRNGARRTEEVTGSYHCQLYDVTPDAYGDTAAEATSLILPSTVTGWFERRDDVDVFQAVLSPESFYAVSCESVDPRPCQFRILSPAGAELVNGTSASGTVLFAPTTAGSHILELRGQGIQTYALRLRLEGTDDHGDSSETATPLQPDVSVSGAIQGVGDVDVLTFDSLAGHGYRFDCGLGNEGSTLRLTLRGADGSVVRSEFPHVQVGTTAPTAQRYTVEVQATSQRADYTCTLVDRGQGA
ncbi:hypothetical protein ACLESO_14020 [Pyxidicoccus sp. 3LG]